jgi:hypothetical protein
MRNMSRICQLSFAAFVFSIVVLFTTEFVSPSMIVDLKITDDLYRLKFLRQAIDTFKKDNGSLPNEDIWMRQLSSGSNPILDESPQDRWDRPYIYKRVSDAPGYVVYSAGRNGIDEKGQGDDITTPEKKYSCDSYGVNCPPTIGAIFMGFLALSSALSLAVWIVLVLYSAIRSLRRQNI